MRLNVTRPVAVATLVLAVLGSITCSGDDVTPPSGEPAAIAAVAGTGQTGRVSQPLAQLIAVRVTDVSQNPVSGVRVDFDPGSGSSGASASPSAATSNSDGEASTSWTLPRTSGEPTLVARVAGTALTVTFMATAKAAEPDTISVVSGQDQAGLPSAQLPESLKVQVRDQYGNAVEGVAVTWAAAGDGTVDPTETITDANGYAAAARTLGLTNSSTTASAAALKGSPVAFAHRVVAPAAVTIVTAPSSEARTGTPLVQQPVIEVRDAAGNLLDGIEVVATVESGGGVLSGATALAAGGRATFTGLAISGATGPQVLRFSAGPAFVLSNPITLSTGPSNGQGQWAAPVSMPLVGIHISLLPNGKVLMFSRTTQPYMWDPSNPGTFNIMPVSTNVFCSGHTLLGDGTLFVVGGHIAEDTGLPDLNLFNPNGNVWSRQPNMVVGRWYPTATVLGNGEVLVLGGRDENKEYSTIPEIWSPQTGWRQLTGPGVARPMPYYPRMFVAPNGKTFFAGPWQTTRYFDQSGNGEWEPVIPRVIDRNRTYGSAVMYESGKILVVGGADPPENTAETIDLNQASPSWTMTGSMAYKRRHNTATVLPDGQVLVTGGSSAPGFNNETGAVLTPEMWNPQTGVWTAMAPHRFGRVYHGTALLLPDGRVLLTGSGEGGGGFDQKTYEVYSPPYLFKGPRPTITAAPSGVAYGEAFQVQSPEAGSITKVTFIRLGSVTHAFDESQRLLSLSYTVSGNALTVSAPANGNLAPPGHYLLSLVNGEGVPSVSKIIQIR
jgi:Domain of unknown function (DUF1929)/Glyoxal oxidase N-terminus/Bacterial Ig-like domain (group 1)